jgi:hypothetical protein
MAAVDEFGDLLSRAYGVPFTDQFGSTVTRSRVLLDRLRTTLGHGPSEVAPMLDDLDAMVQRAKPMPLTDQIRIDRGQIYDVLDRMRTSIADES